MSKELFRTFCWSCNKPVGRIRRYHDSAVEEAQKHEGRSGDHRTSILKSINRVGLALEAQYIIENRS
jgi:hypothetical protein